MSELDKRSRQNLRDSPEYASDWYGMGNLKRKFYLVKRKFSENSFMIWPLIIERAVVFQEPLNQRRLLNLIVHLSLFINLIYERYVTRIFTIVEILKILIQNIINKNPINICFITFFNFLKLDFDHFHNFFHIFYKKIINN